MDNQNTTEQPIAEFGSIVLTIDHMVTDAPPEHTVRKMVASTQTLAESVLGLIGYYGDTALLGRESTIDVLASIKGAENPIVIYQTRENVQIVMSVETQMFAVENLGRGSFLMATGEIERVVAAVTNDQMNQMGGVVPLTVFDFSTTDPDATEQAAPVEEVRTPAPRGRRRKGG